MKRRLIIWGPGEVGGAALRAAHASGRFEIVGVKVWSPRKHGRDAGELVGIGPIGVKATRSKAELLALDADCAIVTPQPRAVLEGLDADVIDLLESGKSVVSTAAYHDVAMPNWFNRARTASARLREIARTRGAAASRWERVALAIARAWTATRLFDPITNVLARPFIDRRLPARATAERLLAACRRGKSALHGTGVHPTFMVERLLMRLCHSLERVEHIRFAESGDFARAPEGMWGGLGFFGFGRDPRELGADWVVAKAGDFYYGDLIGNVAHALYGARPDQVRVERTFRGLPARAELQVGKTTIRAGATAALHMVHRGYLGERCFFTNEECWYLGADNAYFGEGVAADALPAHGGYVFDVDGAPARVSGTLAWPELPAGGGHPITAASVNALLDAVEPVCAASPGIIIDDARPRVRVDDGAAPARVDGAPATSKRPRATPPRVIVRGGEALAAAVKARFPTVDVGSREELLAADADCVVVAGDPDLVVAALASGKDVVAIGPGGDVDDDRLHEAARRGGASVHRIAVDRLMRDRIGATMAQALSSVRRITVEEPAPASFAIRIEGEPAALVGRWTFAGDGDPIGALCTTLAVEAIEPVCAAAPGLMIEDATPRYQHDDRVEG